MQPKFIQKLVVLASLLPALAQAQVTVQSTDELEQAVRTAQAGARITLARGRYDLTGPLRLTAAGGQLLGAGLPHEVLLSVPGRTEVLQITAPGWTVASMTLVGLGGGVVVSSEGSGASLQSLLILGGATGISLGDSFDLECALTGVLLTNNVIADITGTAIEIGSGCDVQILHQTVWLAGLPLLVQGPSNAPRLTNNIWSQSVIPLGQGDLVLPDPADESWFVAASQGDFHLLPDAPPIAKGVPVALVPRDAEGRQRSTQAPDVGAYQYSADSGGADGGVRGDGGVGGGIGGSGGRGQPAQGLGCGCAVTRPIPDAALRGSLLTLLLLLGWLGLLHRSRR